MLQEMSSSLTGVSQKAQGFRPQPSPTVVHAGAEGINIILQKHLTSFIPMDALGILNTQSFHNVRLAYLMRELFGGFGSR
jgi:hypothetical protein